MKSRDGGYKYLAVESYLRENLARGEYSPERPVESESQLSEMFQLSRATVRHAFGRLEGEGLIERRQGRRSYAALERRAYRGGRHGRAAMLTCGPSYFDSRRSALLAEGCEVLCAASTAPPPPSGARWGN